MVVKEKTCRRNRQLENFQASEFWRSLANLKWRSTVFETNHLVWLVVKCQSLPKWAFKKTSTKFIATNGWGPFVEIKFNISTVDWLRGLLSVETFFRLETSTSTMPSLNEQFRKSKANGSGHRDTHTRPLRGV